MFLQGLWLRQLALQSVSSVTTKKATTTAAQELWQGKDHYWFAKSAHSAVMKDGLDLLP